MSATDLRIAFVTGTLQLGGSTTFLCNLAGELIRRGVGCRVYCGDKLHPLARDFEQRRIPISLHDHERSIFEDRLYAVLHELSDYRPNVIVATLAEFAFEALRYLPCDVLRIAMVQSDDPLVYRTVEKYAGCMDEIVGVSAVIVRRLEEIAAFREVPKHYLPYGVTIPEQTASRAAAGKPLRILYLGRINNEQKRVHLFPKIVASLEKARLPFHWTIVGDGPDRVALERKMKSSASGRRVEFIGTVNYSDVARVLDMHDIFILVSDYEGLPLSLLEAMGHGLVPVVSDLESGIREVVDEHNGMLVPVDDVDGYARAIVHLNENRKELLAKSAAARERVRREFSVEATADRWLRVLEAAARPVQWPREFHVRGVLIDPQQWKYALPVRSLRRFLKKILGHSGQGRNVSASSRIHRGAR